MHLISSRRVVTLLGLVLTAVLTVGLLAIASPAHAETMVERSQRRLNQLGCNAGPVDGDVGTWTRSAVIRFQSRHGLSQSGRLDRRTRTRLHSRNAARCDRRPVPSGSGSGRRVVISQKQNWVWLVGPRGGVVAQAGMVDNSSELGRGSYRHGSYCGRAAKIRRNTTTSGGVWLDNFVRFAPCGFGFHRIPTRQQGGAQIHADHILGTNLASSHGCIRLSRGMSEKVWDFVRAGTLVRVV